MYLLNINYSVYILWDTLNDNWYVVTVTEDISRSYAYFQIVLKTSSDERRHYRTVERIRRNHLS